jgi:molybdopterin molybdotransferase
VIVSVRLFATLRDMVPDGRKVLEISVPEGTTVADLVARLGIPPGTVRKVFVGGIAREESYVLQPGDEVGIFPPIAGGAPVQEFLHITSVTDARARLMDAWTPPPPRIAAVDLGQADGRVLAMAVRAPEDLPPFPRSVVDGYAVRAADTFGASESLPAYLAVVGEVAMGRPPGVSIAPGEAARIPTGGVLPPGADAVVMVEHTETLIGSTPLAPNATECIEVRRPVGPGESVIQPGEDARRGEVVLPAGVVLRAPQIGLLAGLGIKRVNVAVSPRVAVVSTGDEVVAPDRTPEAGCIRDINGPALCAAVRAEGGNPIFCGIVPDEYGPLLAAIRTALAQADLVLISGGSSIGLRDEVTRVIDALGPPGVIVHGVAMKPGKPTVLGLCDRVPVVGLPGHPTTVLVVFHVFVREIIGRLLGRQPEPLPQVRARLARRISSATGRTDYLRVRLEHRDGTLWALPILGKSGLITTMVGADGLAVIPDPVEGVEAGEEVTVEVFVR